MKYYKQIIREHIRKILNEEHISDMSTFWAWVSPENTLIRVPKLNHKDFIMRKYKEYNNSIIRKYQGWDYDKIFYQALKDGWVRVIYEYYPNQFKGDLNLNGISEDRVRDVLKNVFRDLIKYGHKNIYLAFEDSNGYKSFSTFSTEGKLNFIDYLN